MTLQLHTNGKSFIGSQSATDLTLSDLEKSTLRLLSFERLIVLVLLLNTDLKSVASSNASSDFSLHDLEKSNLSSLPFRTLIFQKVVLGLVTVMIY